MKIRALGALAIATALFAPAPSGAQQHREGVVPGECKGGTQIDREGVKVMLYEPIPGLPGKCIRVTQIVLDPGKDAGEHTHPGDEYGIVLEGTLMLKRGCAAYEPAGNKFSVPRGPSMNVNNTTDRPAMCISILI